MAGLVCCAARPHKPPAATTGIFNKPSCQSVPDAWRGRRRFPTGRPGPASGVVARKEMLRASPPGLLRCGRRRHKNRRGGTNSVGCSGTVQCITAASRPLNSLLRAKVYTQHWTDTTVWNFLLCWTGIILCLQRAEACKIRRKPPRS